MLEPLLTADLEDRILPACLKLPTRIVLKSDLSKESSQSKIKDQKGRS